MAISGASLLPYCHLDLPERKYYDLKIASLPRLATNVRSSSQLNMEETSSVDPATKVIEFISTGTGNKIIRYANSTSIFNLVGKRLTSLYLFLVS